MTNKTQTDKIEELRIKLVGWIPELLVEWRSRPFTGKGSDRSDLIEKLANKIDRFYSKALQSQKQKVLGEIKKYIREKSTLTPEFRAEIISYLEGIKIRPK